MSGCSVRVLGRVEVWVDGKPVRLAAQQTKVLAMLVAAGRKGTVSRSDLLDALWATAPEGSSLYPVVSQLRKPLKACGLTVSKARGQHTYRLQPAGDGTSLGAVVDAIAFEELVDRAHALLADGRAEAALAAFRSAAEIWRGTPTEHRRTWWHPARARSGNWPSWSQRCCDRWRATANSRSSLRTPTG